MRLAPLLIAACVLAVYAAPATAEQLYATEGTSLVAFDSAAPRTVSSPVPITGLAEGETLVGIDIRPADGLLYGVSSSSRLYRIDPATGAVTQIGSDGAFALNGSAFGTDFNPAADRLRVVSDNEQNLRLNPAGGAVVDAALNPASNIVAAAYTNNVQGATSTTLYDIDSGNGELRMQGGASGAPPSPNTGTHTLVGSLGLGAGLNPAIGFEITPAGAAYASINPGTGTSLYAIDLSTGAATPVATIGNGSINYSGLTTAASLQFAAASADASEGGTATLSVTRSGPNVAAATVDYATSAGSATAGGDFTPVSGTLSWPSGDSAPKTIDVPIPSDAAGEPAETFSVNLSNPTGNPALGSPSTATVTIAESAAAPPPPPPADVVAPSLGLGGPQSQPLRRALRRGVKFRATTDEACALVADLRISKRLARRLGLKRRIGRMRVALAVGTRALRVKPTKKARRKLRRRRRVPVTIATGCSDAAGNRAVARRKVTLKR